MTQLLNILLSLAAVVGAVVIRLQILVVGVLVVIVQRLGYLCRQLAIQ
jgi:hypothetical protein